MIKPRLTKAQKKLLGLKQQKFPIEAVERIMLTKEAIASCALDGETQCGDMTIEPIFHKHNFKGNICCEVCYRLGKLSAQKETAEKVKKLKDRLQYIIPTEDELYFDDAFKEIFGDTK